MLLPHARRRSNFDYKILFAYALGTTVGAINYLHSNLRRFMRPERRHVAAIFKPASARVVYQPLGVVGIVSPWNFPVSLALTPLATALAAGNRVMLKPSEMTPATTDLLASMLAETFELCPKCAHAQPI